MATSVSLSASLCSPAVACKTVNGARAAQPRAQAVRMSNFAGLKLAGPAVSALASPVSVEERFAQMAHSVRATKRGRGALAATNSIGEEIFQTMTVMWGITLLGIAVGFILLRVEAAVEESE